MNLLVWSRPRARRPSSAVGLGTILTLFSTALLLVIAIGGPTQQRWPLAGLAVTEVGCILAPTLLFVRWWKLPIRDALRLHPVAPWDVLLALAVGIASWGGAAMVFAAGGGQLRFPAAVPALSELLLRVVIVGIIAGICEEVLFRGVLQGLAERGGRIRGVVTVAVLFGLFHLDARVPGAAFLGIIFGMLTSRYGSIWPAVVAHAANNSAGLVMSRLFAGASGAQVLGIAAILASGLLVLLPLTWQRTSVSAVSDSVQIFRTIAPSPSRRWRTAIAAVLALALALTTVAAIAIDIRVLPSDSLSPLIAKGSTVLVVPLTPQRQQRMGPGHMVGVRLNGVVDYGVIVRSADQEVSVRAAGNENRYDRSGLVEVIVYPRILPRDALAAIRSGN